MTISTRRQLRVLNVLAGLCAGGAVVLVAASFLNLWPVVQIGGAL